MITPLAIVWDIDPVLFNIFGFEIRYYSISWMLAFLLCIYVMNKMLRKEGLSSAVTDKMFLYTFIATVVGARIGHCLFYETAYYLSNPLEMFNLRQGGLASHGAAFGLLLGIYLFSKKYKFGYMWSLDRITAVIPLGGAAIRLGNLMNSEIYGTQTDLPWGFIFTLRGETLPMHPTQLYEALAYLAIFALLMYLYFKKSMAEKRPGAMFGIFLITLFGSRFIIEMIKNVQESFEEAMTFNMGQLLSVPFVIMGCVILWLAYKRDYFKTKDQNRFIKEEFKYKANTKKGKK